MRDKWENFTHANSSNLNITNPNTTRSSLKNDWARVSKNNNLSINGNLLKDIAKNYNDFETEGDVINFIELEIIKDTGDEISKDDAIDYLKGALHQGGLMFPVSSALAMSLKTKSGELLGTINDQTLTQKIHIQTTSKGFKVQEFAYVREIMVPAGPLQKFANDQYIMSPNNGESYLIQAQGTIDVDFSQNAKTPTLSIESNQMNINHASLSKHIDNRGLGQIIVDFLKNIVGLNKVQDISTKIEDENDDLQQDSTSSLSP